MNVLRFAIRATRREIFAGDLLTVFVALVLGVTVMTAVSTLTHRVDRALTASAAEVIGGDLGLTGRQAIPLHYVEEARQRGLRTSYSIGFPTVLFHGDVSQMASIKAVDAHYPLRGQLRVATDRGGLGEAPAGAPAPGQAYADARLFEALGLQLGDRIELGDSTVTVVRVLKSEPNPSGELLQMAPPLMINRQDVERIGLLGPGSRAQYQLMFASDDTSAIQEFQKWLKTHAAGFRLVNLDQSQRGLRDTFDRAGRFLSMTALLAVLLAGVAIALAANRFAARRVDSVAVLRCLGARQRDILASLVMQMLLLALPACGLGILLGTLLQSGLIALLSQLLPDQLPLPTTRPDLTGVGIGMLLLLGFGLPPLLTLRDVPPMRVLNRNFAKLPALSIIIYLSAIATTVIITTIATQDMTLTAWMLGGLTVLAAIAATTGWLLLRLTHTLQGRLKGVWKLGLAALTRRRSLSILQLAGLSLSLCALLLLAVSGPGLLQQWRARLPSDTPNYFLINIQPNQADAVRETLTALGVDHPHLEPMATGRLIAVNGTTPTSPSSPDDTQPPNDANRPVNFTWRHEFPEANTLTAGQFWARDSTMPEASLEVQWAQRYGIRLGDQLTLEIGDQRKQFRVTSLREAHWDSFQVNFFILLNAGAIEDDTPHNLISSFYLSSTQATELGPLTRQFPNLSVIDIEALLQHVHHVINRVAQAVQLIMGFSLIAGVLVLLAALQATADERRYDNAILRTLGAQRRQLQGAVLVEFGALGVWAALLAVLAAAALGTGFAYNAFNRLIAPPWMALTAGGALGVILSLTAGWAGTRRILRIPPAVALRAD